MDMRLDFYDSISRVGCAATAFETRDTLTRESRRLSDLFPRDAILRFSLRSIIHDTWRDIEIYIENLSLKHDRAHACRSACITFLHCLQVRRRTVPWDIRTLVAQTLWTMRRDEAWDIWKRQTLGDVLGRPSKK